MLMSRLDPVPKSRAGIRTIKCSDCTWEATFIIPEEAEMATVKILQHIVSHEIKIPTFTATDH